MSGPKKALVLSYRNPNNAQPAPTGGMVLGILSAMMGFAFLLLLVAVLILPRLEPQFGIYGSVETFFICLYSSLIAAFGLGIGWRLIRRDDSPDN